MNNFDEQDFFDQFGDYHVRLKFYESESSISLEGLFQMFKSRIEREEAARHVDQEPFVTTPPSISTKDHMRLTLIHQINELIDVAWRGVLLAQQKGDKEEAGRIEGAINYARNAMKPYNHNGPTR